MSLLNLLCSVVHVLTIVRIAILLYLVGPLYVYRGIDEFFTTLTNVTFALSVITLVVKSVHRNRWLALFRRLTTFLLLNGVKLLLVNQLVRENVNGYLYALLVVLYSLEKVLGGNLVYMGISAVEIILLFNGLAVEDELWLKAIVVAYVPVRWFV